jgi:hypothetical protein
MPLLRGPHDHRRELRARRRTSRPILAASRGQDRDAMTPTPASLPLLLAGEPRFPQCTAVAPLSPKALLIPSIAVTSPRLRPPQRPVYRRNCRPRPQPRRPAHPLPEPLPGQTPIDSARPHHGPRVPSWEAFGRRPSEPTRIATTGPRPKPFTKADRRTVMLNDRGGWPPLRERDRS